MPNVILNGNSKKIMLNGVQYLGGGGSTPTLITKAITENGTYSAEDDSADGYSEVEVDVEPNVGTKTITENGTYNASSDGLQGFSQVVVNVQGVDPSQFNYDWYYNPSKTMVVRVTKATGNYKIWFENFVIDTIVSNKYRQPVPTNLKVYAMDRVGVAVNYLGYNTDMSADVTGSLTFYNINGSYYVGATMSGSSYTLHGTVEKAIITSSMAAGNNTVDYNTEWTEPSFDPING